MFVVLGVSVSSEAVCDGVGLRCFSRAADQQEVKGEGVVGGGGLCVASQDFQVVDVWREGRPMDEAL